MSLMLILFCVIIVVLLFLFYVMFVVVMIVVIVVTFWCVENAWLCVMCRWPNECDGYDVVLVGYNLVLIVVIVVTCCCCVALPSGDLLMPSMVVVV